jgi:ferredoxin
MDCRSTPNDVSVGLFKYEAITEEIVPVKETTHTSELSVLNCVGCGRCVYIGTELPS